MQWLSRFGAVCGVILGLSLGVPGVVEAFTGETVVTSFVVGLGAAFGAPALYAYQLRQADAAGRRRRRSCRRRSSPIAGSHSVSRRRRRRTCA